MNAHFSYAVVTKPGNRPVNEDSVGVFENGGNYCFILCDGLGGHGMGDVASELCRSVFEDQFFKTNDFGNFLGQAFLTAQDFILAEQKSRRVKNKMKTTAVAVVADERNAYIGHVGDSRLYVFQHNKMKVRTLDHSVPQMLVLSKEIKESQIRNHPDRNILLRVLGEPWDEPKYELMAPRPLKACSAFLLCSDGFWELIEEKEMCSLLKKADSVEEWLFAMTDIVKKNGSGRNMDNYSAIAIWLDREKRK